MKRRQVQEVLEATPFRAFRVAVQDGKELPVLHHEMVKLMPKDDVLLVFKESGWFHIVELDQISRIELLSHRERQDQIKQIRS